MRKELEMGREEREEFTRGGGSKGKNCGTEISQKSFGVCFVFVLGRGVQARSGNQMCKSLEFDSS